MKTRNRIAAISAFIVIAGILVTIHGDLAQASWIDLVNTDQLTITYLPLLLREDPPLNDGGPITSGDVDTLSLLVNLTDAFVACTEEEIEATMFTETNSVNAAYSESSRSALTISGDVATVAIDYASSDGCVREEWASAANAAAQAKGYDLSDYDRFVYLMPLEPLHEICPWGANSSLDRKRVWTLRCNQPQTVAHELGHTFGIYHASTDTDEYGDFSDPMGGKIGMPLTQFNAPHRAQMGWLPESAIEDITVSGTYFVEATEVDPNKATNYQILRIKKPDTDEYYYVSFRFGIGLDTNLESAYRDNFISVHRYRGFGFAPGYPPPNTYLEALLGQGKSFVDQTNGIRITLLSYQNEIATVIIEKE